MNLPNPLDPTSNETGPVATSISATQLMQVNVSQGQYLNVGVDFRGQNHGFQLELGFWDKQKTANDYIYLWMLECFRSIECTEQVTEIKLNFNTEVDKTIRDLVIVILKMINNTRKLMHWGNTHAQIDRFKEMAQGKCLVVNVDENAWGLGFYEAIAKQAPDTLIRNLKSGFNRMTRRWETSDLLGEPEALIDYLIQNQIKTIVTLNVYLFQNYMEYKVVFFDRVLAALGIKVVMFDVDHFTNMSTGMWYKRIFTSDNMFRQTHIPLDYAADIRFGVNQIRYVSLPTRLTDPSSWGNQTPTFPVFNKPPKLIVMSNLRLDNIMAVLGQILWLHERLDANNPYQDYIRWFSAVRAVIGRPYLMSEYADCVSGALIAQIAYTYGHLAKLLIVHELMQDYEIEIYGDQSWSQFFPGLYRGYASGEKKASLLKEPGALQLMFNWNDSWLSGSNVLQHLANGVPFLNFPPEVVPTEWAPFEAFSYRTIDELKTRLSQPLDFNTAELAQALAHNVRIIKAGWKDSVACAIDPQPAQYADRFAGLYGASQKQHLELRDSYVNTFLQTRAPMIEESIGLLVPNKPFAFPLGDCSIAAHPVVQRLVSLHREKRG